jgi:hypothetical protein
MKRGREEGRVEEVGEGGRRVGKKGREERTRH